jgi:cysteine desulfurase
MDLTKCIYLDNNATTNMPLEVIAEMVKWCNQGNPSASYSSATRARKMMEELRNYIGKLCSIDTCCPEERDSITADRCDVNRYKIILTSGASEGNSMIVSGVISAYADARGVTPHVIMGATEHKGVIMLAHTLEDRGAATFTFIAPDPYGYTPAEAILEAITPKTCLICVMSANNETGAINDIGEIGAIAHSNGIVFHCDTVQSFGKTPIRPLEVGADSFCVSFHKFHGPPGVGILAVKQKFLLGYDLPPIIFGVQNEGYRGGTENLPGIGAAFAALKYNFASRLEKNEKLLMLKGRLLSGICGCFPCRTYHEYVGSRVGGEVSLHQTPHQQIPPLEVVVFSAMRTPDGKFNIDPALYLCNTLFISVVKRTGEYICNTKIKNFMYSRGVIISVGSACNTASSKASHVLYAMGADQYIRKGALRISIGDDNTRADIDNCVVALKDAVAAQL